MDSRRKFLAAIAVAPLALSLPALAYPSWDAETWLRQWSSMGGSVMLAGGELSFAFRPEDHEKARPLIRQIRERPGAERAVRQFILDRGIKGYSFGICAS